MHLLYDTYVDTMYTFTSVTYKHGITLECEIVPSSTKYCTYIDMKQDPSGVNVHYKRRIRSLTQPHDMHSSTYRQPRRNYSSKSVVVFNYRLRAENGVHKIGGARRQQCQHKGSLDTAIVTRHQNYLIVTQAVRRTQLSA